MQTRICKNLVYEAKVRPLENLETGLGVGVEVCLVVEGMGTANQIGTDENSGHRAKDRDTVQQHTANDLSAWYDRARIRKPVTIDPAIIKSI